MSQKILVTGSSGFIGFHLCKKLLNYGYEVLGVDNMNTYYSVKLKKDRLSILSLEKNYSFKNVDISNLKALESAFKDYKPCKVVNLAAQAGVRYSLKNPHAYIQSNINGFMNILECCKNFDIKGLIYASSSSVYGLNEKTPFSIDDRVDFPMSIYAATKRSNELMAHSYSHLYGLNTTGLRFFSVYGPWGRPDMAIYIFVERIQSGKSILLFNDGIMKRDFTFIDDIVSGIINAVKKNYKCEIFNLGNSKPENLLNIVAIIEDFLGKKAVIEYRGMQPGDVEKTFADINHSNNLLNYNPKISIEKGIPLFIKWFNKYKRI